jgi:tetratricopeptide (TPR) repeat protein
LKRAEERGTPEALRDALDAAWRADDWQAGLKVAERARRDFPRAKELHALVVRALWRAGRILEAEELARELAPKSKDRVALRMLIEIALARGELDKAAKAATELEKLKQPTVEDLYHVYAARFARSEIKGLAQALREIEKRADPANGYPESYFAEAIEGVADFLQAVGNEPLNQVTRHGAAPLTPLTMINLPSCDVFLNGHGPYRMVVDTGGSIMLSIDQAVADEAGLKSLGKASVRGVSGKQETGQALVDEVAIGTIRCKRVVARTFNVRGAVMNAADGIIGTGMFAPARMTLDFHEGQLVLEPSSAKPAAGEALDLRIIGDAKLIAPVSMEGHPALAMLDTGADAVAVSPLRLKQLFPNEPVRRVDVGIQIGVGGGDASKLAFTSGVKLVLGGRTFENYGGLGLDVLDEILSPVIGTQLDILIGMPTFRQMRRFTVDFEKCRSWVEWEAE